MLSPFPFGPELPPAESPSQAGGLREDLVGKGQVCGPRRCPVSGPRGGDCGEICLHSLPEFPQIFLPLCRSHLKCYYIIHYLGDFQRLTSSTQARDRQSCSSRGGHRGCI